MSLQKWLSGRIVGVQRWTPTLFSLRFETPGFIPFVAGQFARVGLMVGEEVVARPYSLVNPPAESILEILIIEVENGPLSPLLNRLEKGDELLVMPRANGFFSIEETPPAEVLWCLATGTGLGPFLSMLRTPKPWVQFKKIILVHGVRFPEEAVYRDVIAGIERDHPDQFGSILLVSRGAVPTIEHTTAVSGRMTSRFDSGDLERCAGVPLDISSHVMLCGNPQMVADMIQRMEARGMRKHRKREPGHFTTEAYW